jgi:hypothetical protein
MEAICSSETSVATQQIIRRLIPEDDTFHNHRCENLKSYIYLPYYVIKTDLKKYKRMLDYKLERETRSCITNVEPTACP